MLILLSVVIVALNAFAEDDFGCYAEWQSFTNQGSPIEIWGDDYQPCLRYEWNLMFPNEWSYVEFDYTIDLNPTGAIDAILIYLLDESGQEREILNYQYQPIAGKITLPLHSSSARVVFISEYGNTGELYHGFKLSYRQGNSTLNDHVFYSNVGIGIQPQERLHVNGAIRGDGESGSLRIRTAAGTTEIGAADSIYSHFYTDRSAYFFNKPVYLSGGTLAAYGNNSLKFQTNDTNRMIINSDGDIELLGNTYLNGAINGDGENGSLRIRTTTGTTEIGAADSVYSHFYTDRSAYFFNKPIYLSGGTLAAYGNNSLKFQTNDTNRMVIDTTGTINILGDASVEGSSHFHGKTYLYNDIQMDGVIRCSSRYNQAIRIASGYGYTDMGAVNTGYFHFYTDRPGYYFNKALTVNGGTFRAASENNLYLNTFDRTRLTILYKNGYVGIGTKSPEYKLDVNGTIRADGIIADGTIRADELVVDGTIQAEEIIVKTTGADFVFAEDYQLRPLSDVKTFIQENKHLPEIKSAQEMQENGVGINELQTQLLQKIEELTLYILQQEEIISNLNYRIQKLEQE